MRAPRLTELLGILCLLALAAVLDPVFAPAQPHHNHRPCLSFVKQQAIALVLYVDDADDRLPPRDAWMDATDPYLKNEGLRHCPSVPKGSYGYAFNGALDGQRLSKIEDVATTPMLYDSVNPIRNASDLVTSLPSPGRHRGRNTIGYADGHAKAVPLG